MNAAVFWTDVENAQQFEFFPVGSIQAVSKIDEQEITGWEVDANFIVNDKLSLFAGYGYTDAEVTKLQAQPSFEGNVVPYIEEYNFVGGFRANYPPYGRVDAHCTRSIHAFRRGMVRLRQSGGLREKPHQPARRAFGHSRRRLVSHALG